MRKQYIKEDVKEKKTNIYYCCCCCCCYYYYYYHHHHHNNNNNNNSKDEQGLSNLGLIAAYANNIVNDTVAQSSNLSVLNSQAPAYSSFNVKMVSLFPQTVVDKSVALFRKSSNRLKNGRPQIRASCVCCRYRAFYSIIYVHQITQVYTTKVHKPVKSVITAVFR